MCSFRRSSPCVIHCDYLQQFARNEIAENLHAFGCFLQIESNRAYSAALHFISTVTAHNMHQIDAFFRDNYDKYHFMQIARRIENDITRWPIKLALFEDRKMGKALNHMGVRRGHTISGKSCQYCSKTKPESIWEKISS